MPINQKNTDNNHKLTRESIDNKLYSWGLNIFGQLGLGHNDNMDQPTLVEKLAFFENQTQEYDSTNLKETSFQSNQDIVDIKAGPQHSLILLSETDPIVFKIISREIISLFFDT